MQTVEPYVEPAGDEPPEGLGPLTVALIGLAVVAGSVLAIQTRFGVVAAIALAFVLGALVFVLRRGFGFVEVVAFLVHFDGLGVGQVSLGRIISAVTLGLIGYKLVIERWRPPAVPVRYWLPPLAFVTWGLASAAWSAEIGSWLLGLGVYGLGLAYFSVAALLVDSYAKIQKFLRAYWYGGIFGALAGIWALVLGVRSFGFNGDANLFGVLAASMIPLTFYYRRHAVNTQQKLMYTAVLVLVLLGASGAGSRSGLIGAGVAFFGSLIYRPGESIRRRVAMVVPAAIATVAIGVGFILLNPNTAVRGTDSSGRLDFWKVTVDLIAERPLTGHGLRQIPGMIPDRLATTPGTRAQTDSREEVSSHNTWLDVTGDLGIVGASLFLLVVVVTVVGLLRPRWRQTKELSGYIALMFLPVLTGSMFLALQNNKLAWSVIGLAGALQVPSWGNRYRGYFAPQRRAEPGERWDARTLARWDLRVSQRFRVWIALAALAGAVVMGVVGSGLPSRHFASMAIDVPKLDIPPGLDFVPIDTSRVQTLHTLVLSDAYAFQLQQLAGLDLTVEEVADGVQVVRPDYGPFLDISFTSTDAAQVELAGPHLLEALDAVIERGRVASIPQLDEEVRPASPGEQRYYTGPMYLPVSAEPYYGVQEPRRTWLVIVGALTGAAVAGGYSLFQQRRPRVNNDDDFRRAVGLPLWTHVGRVGRRNAATADQYAQVAITAFEATGTSDWPPRVLVATPSHSRSARALAVGVAASIAGAGRRVLLVDGQAGRPSLSARLGGWRSRGMNDLAQGRTSLDRVIRRVRRWRLPRAARRALGENRDNLRFVPAGRRRRGEEATVDPGDLGGLEDGVVVVVLAPPLLGTVPVSPSIRWADVVIYDLVEGETVTFDAEDAALQVATFARGPAGVVLSDV